MAQIFPPSFNTISRLSILGIIGFAIAVASGWALFLDSPYVTEVGVPIQQPIQFSHQHHVRGIGIDCRYCHTSEEHSNFAGIPPIHTCMTCHSQIWSDSPYLLPVRQSFATGIPIHWVRVHDLPDFVYFDHSIHIQKGIGCYSCHGPVDQMPLIWKAQNLHMRWCLSCHEEPEKFVRPRAEVFSMKWKAPQDQERLGRQLVKQYGIQKKTNCTTCHR